MTTVGSKTQKNAFSAPKTLALTAMFAALTTVLTMFVRVSTPLGYIHAGDAMVYLGAALLPQPFGFISASLGGALADLLSGYAHFSVFTAMIKALNVLPFFIARIILIKKNKDDKIISLPLLLMLLPSALITVGGYFAANALLYDAGAAVGELLTDAVQAASGAVIFILLGAGLDRTRLKQRLR